jgi:hypothetical protein
MNAEQLLDPGRGCQRPDVITLVEDLSYRGKSVWNIARLVGLPRHEVIEISRPMRRFLEQQHHTPRWLAGGRRREFPEDFGKNWGS